LKISSLRFPICGEIQVFAQQSRLNAHLGLRSTCRVTRHFVYVSPATPRASPRFAKSRPRRGSRATGDFDNDFSMWQNVGLNFLQAIMPIYKRRHSMPFGHSEKERQLELRAHYVEFNLLYDRGTKFGFLSSGNPDAILCSMPPCTKW